jgi:lysophosphatidate acyltransferase
MFYLKVSAMVCVAVLAALMGTVWSVVRWGDPEVLAKWVKMLSRIILKIAGIRIRVKDAHNLTDSQPCIYMINHQSGLDLFTLGYVAPPRTTVIAKKELQWAPVIGLFFTAAGVIFLDRKDRRGAIHQLGKAAQVIRKRQVSVGIAPEGTRNQKGNGILEFKKGPFHLAIQAQVPIVPFICSPLYPLGSFAERRLQPGQLEIQALAPIQTEGLSAVDVDRLMAKTHAAMSEAQSQLKTQIF